MKNKCFYITTPIYYVNGKPHIGHAYTNILCDTISRFRRFIGEEVFFLTGTDEHGTKVEKAAREQNKDPKVYVDELVPVFKQLWALLGIRYDGFIRTTDEQHKRIVQNTLLDLEKKGEIYKASYQGWYCFPCESFWTELQLAEGKCPDCQREVQKLSEENYFFRLSKYQAWLVETIQSHPEFIQPEIRRNEILGFLREPLEDLCITRPKARLAWGIEYPGSKDHVVYVWFDALMNYVTAVQYSENPKRFAECWPADVHMIGKDILRHHAVYWPIMLKACGIEMPKTILAHGWWTMQGAKMSKSRGNIVDPFLIVRTYGADAFRYFLLHEVTLGLDGSYSEDLLRERYTSDLANDLGNLWFRLASMVDKYFAGQIPQGSEGGVREPLLQAAYGLWTQVYDSMRANDPRGALDEIWAVVTAANQFVEEKKPWVLAKDQAKRGELADALWVLAETLAHIGCILQIFLPETSRKILTRLGLPDEMPIGEDAAFRKPLLRVGTKIDRGDALFPKLEEEAV